MAPEGLDSLGAREGFAGISEVIDKHFDAYEGSNCFLKSSQELNNNHVLTHMPSPLLWGLKTVGAQVIPADSCPACFLLCHEKCKLRGMGFGCEDR